MCCALKNKQILANFGCTAFIIQPAIYFFILYSQKCEWRNEKDWPTPMIPIHTCFHNVCRFTSFQCINITCFCEHCIWYGTLTLTDTHNVNETEWYGIWSLDKKWVNGKIYYALQWLKIRLLVAQSILYLFWKCVCDNGYDMAFIHSRPLPPLAGYRNEMFFTVWHFTKNCGKTLNDVALNQCMLIRYTIAETHNTL